jgi:two-component system alkaline phosphatase synthesis response regulator PhoP
MASEPNTIVCIEDEPGVIELIRLILERRGLKVVGAGSGAKGLEVVRQVKPALVLLDLMMPGMDGWEVYRRMQAEPDLCDIPVIIVTADGQPATRARALEVAKVDGFIVKPFNIRELVQRIEEVLGSD